MVQFQHSSVMTFLHLNIYVWIPLPHLSILGSVLTFKCDDLSALRHLCVGPLYHTILSLVKFQHPSMMTFLDLNIYV